MAEDSFQEKTEQPTPKRINEARESGNVPKSQEFTSAFLLLSGLIMLSILSSQYLNDLMKLFTSYYQEIGNMSIKKGSLQLHFKAGIKFLILFVAPILSVLVFTSIGVHIAQVGFLFTTKPLVPNIGKLNPIKGFKKLISLKAFIEFIKGNLKFVIVGLIAYWTISAEKENFFLLINESVANILRFIGWIVFKVSMRITTVLFLLAILDLIYQRWQYKRDLRMTKQEVRQESKDADINPIVKNAIRSMQLTRHRQRMMQSVPEADVVITNPTELAIALKYDTEVMLAPIVVAKGARLIAKRIKEIAMLHNIPVIENRPLAQSLYKICEVGKEIPFELYQAIAEVFAYLYQSKQKSF